MTPYPTPRALLDKYGLRAKKSWGQNFLGDVAILDDIARLALPAPGATVVELGAGLGHLTDRLLARGARVIAVERDRDMARVLRGELGDRIVLLEADAARLDYGRLVEEAAGAAAAAAPTTTTTTTATTTTTTVPNTTTTPTAAPNATTTAAPNATTTAAPTAAATTNAAPTAVPTPTTTPSTTAAARTGKLSVVGNLPYHLTSPILFSLLDQAAHLERAVFLVQREVAQRLAAAPGTHEWGILSVLLQREADVSIERIVPRGAFLPPPRVESAVLCAVFRPPTAAILDPARFRRLVKAGFAQRRKTLANALRAAGVAAPEALSAALSRAGIDPGRRAETLTVEEWAVLERAVGEVLHSRAPTR